MREPVILLAEDDESDVEAIQCAFKHLEIKYPLKIVHNGEQVISYLEGEGAFANREHYPFPSLLILDLKMPKVSGWEVLDWLRSKPRAHSLFVIVMTSCGQSEATHQTFEFYGNVCVFSCYLLKPVTIDSVDMLIHFFESWLQSHG
jgi:CheY-like chemotaxis protein